MKTKEKQREILSELFNIGMIAIPVIIGIILAFFFKDNYEYNHKLQKGELTAKHFNGEVYDFGEVQVRLMTRGGDSGAWPKDPILDEDGNELHGASVGIIYEALICNASDNVIKDWSLKIPINEQMWINNNWNSEIEIHQNVCGDEKVLAIDLSEYSRYDINLDYYLDHTGPMIMLYPGDYFVYLPDADANEKPINASKTGDPADAAVGFGFIVYIPNQTLDYEPNFSGGILTYRMYANPVQSVKFWILAGILGVWAIGLLVTIVVRLKTRSLIRKQEELRQHDDMMVDQAMKLVINIFENKDLNTKGHSIRVAEYSMLIADKLGMSEEECRQIFHIGLMHDCGKLNIPDSILKNPGKLSQEEYNTMKQHTTFGAEILKDFTSIEGIAIGAKYHHERFDGKGYPTGLAGEEIPLIARIIGVADAYDAMSSLRCYRERMHPAVIREELEKNRDKQFDGRIVDCILELIDEGTIVSDSFN